MKKFKKIILFISISLFTIIGLGCKEEPSKEITIELVKSLWENDKPSTFLNGKNTDDDFLSLGLNNLPGDTVQFKNIEVLERTEAEKSKESEKEVRMLIKVDGIINTFKNGKLLREMFGIEVHEKIWGKENFSVKHYYIFTKNKFGDWSINSNHKIVR